MELDPNLRAVILIAILVGLGLVIYFELRYMKRRRAPKIDAKLVKDEAYNSLVTTRAVARVLDEKGRDTSKAEQFLFQAENAYSRREYARTKELADEAKEALEVCGDRKEPEGGDELSIIADVESTEEDGETMENKTLFEKEKDLPENYMQSKFMIKNVKRELEMAKGSNMDISEAEHQLRLALENFDKGEYTEALRFACRADRSISQTDTQFIAGNPESVGYPEDPVDGFVNMDTAEKLETLICKECGSPLEQNDIFCSQCGTKVERERICSSCGEPLKENDVFCRKCGTRYQ